MKKIICLMGPTSSGKTDAAFQIFDTFKIDIISVDSALIYKEFDIGTSKPEQDKLVKYPHSLVNIIDANSHYSVANFIKDVSVAIENSFKNNRTPLLVGGTTMYFNALINGLADIPEIDHNIKASLDVKLQQNGIIALYEELKVVDAYSASKIKSNDKQRILRALSVFYGTGKTIGEFYKSQQHIHNYDFLEIAIVPENRTLLHENIERRFDGMLKSGFVEEVRYLLNKYNNNAPAFKLIGYKDIVSYLNGEIALDEARFRAIVSTRQLAKRQLTWLNNWKTKHHRFNINEPEAIINTINNHIN